MTTRSENAMPTPADVVRAVARHVAKHAQKESRFLYPDPQWVVTDPAGLFDALCALTGVTEQQIDAWIEEAESE